MQDWLGDGGLAPGEHVVEPAVGERPEERILGEFRATGCGARGAGEESRLLSRRLERVRMAVAQRLELIGIDDRLDRRCRLGRRKGLSVSAQAMAAMPARLRAGLPEVADQAADLAAVVGDEREHFIDPSGFRALAAREAIQ